MIPTREEPRTVAESKQDTEKQGEAREFAAFLLDVNKGQSNRELSEKLHDLIAKVQDTGNSPATAGGASARGTWRVGHRNPRNLYWTNGLDEHRGVMFDPADGPFVVEALNAQLKVVEAEFNERFLGVGQDPRDIEIERDRLRAAVCAIAAKVGGDMRTPRSVVDAIDSWITKGAERDAEIERLREQLGDVCTALHNQLSDYDECGVFTRDHALYLVRQLGGRVRLRDMTIKAMQEMAKPFSLPDQRGIEIEELRKRLVYDLGLSGGQWSGLSLMELLQRLKAMYTTALDEARGRNGDMRAEIEELETQRDDARTSHDVAARERDEAREEWKRADAEVTRLRKLRETEADDRVKLYAGLVNRIHEALREDAAVETANVGALSNQILRLVNAFEQREGYAAERDRLRAELGLIGESGNAEFLQAEAAYWRTKYDNLSTAVTPLVIQLDKTKYLTPPEPPIGTRFVQTGGTVWTRKDDGWHCPREGCENCPADWASEVYDRVCDAIRYLPGAKPTEPRRWVAGDPEPEIGTTLRSADGRTYTRRSNGSWHSLHCPKSCRAPGPLWSEVLIGAPLVEVVSADG